MNTHNKINFSKIEEKAYKKGYRVTREGDFISYTGRLIKYINKKGYAVCKITIDKKSYILYAHRLQAYQKFGDKIYSNNILTRHLNNNSKDNSFDNIGLGTNKDNMMDRGSEALRQHALKASAKTIKHDAVKIREYYIKSGNKQKETMEKFNISSTGTFWYIINKRINRSL